MQFLWKFTDKLEKKIVALSENRLSFDRRTKVKVPGFNDMVIIGIISTFLKLLKF